MHNTMQVFSAEHLRSVRLSCILSWGGRGRVRWSLGAGQRRNDDFICSFSGKLVNWWDKCKYAVTHDFGQKERGLKINSHPTHSAIQWTAHLLGIGGGGGGLK